MPRKVTLDEMVAVIAEADWPLTEKEIGDRVGVSRPTVAKYREELQSHPDVIHGEVGGSRAYWSEKVGFEPDTDTRRGGGEPRGGGARTQEDDEAEETDSEQTASTSGSGEVLEVLANRRTVLGGAFLLALGAGVLVLAGVLASAGQFGPAFVTLGLSTVTMLLGVGFISVAVYAQLRLARPLKALVVTTERPEVGA